MFKLFRRAAAILLSAVISISTFAGSRAESGPSDEEVRLDVGGFKLNSVLVKAGGIADLPPIVFIHGASANLHDPMFSFRDKLEGRATMLFIDRPGHGQSDGGGDENILPDGQADAIARLMDKRGVRKAVIVGHSFGGAIAAAFAMRHPDKVIGLVFLSPAAYAWPGGIAWYYDAARAPVTGLVFSTLVAPTVGLFAIDKAADAVFSPNPRPADYIEKTKAWQALNPSAFRHNAKEVAALSDWAKTASAGYRNINAPTVIITGDADGIVSPQIHAQHLARDIKGARLISVHNLGHKSDYVASDLAIAAIEAVAGRPRDLNAKAALVEKRIAGDGRS